MPPTENILARSKRQIMDGILNDPDLGPDGQKKALMLAGKFMQSDVWAAFEELVPELSDDLEVALKNPQPGRSPGYDQDDEYDGDGDYDLDFPSEDVAAARHRYGRPSRHLLRYASPGLSTALKAPKLDFNNPAVRARLDGPRPQAPSPAPRAANHDAAHAALNEVHRNYGMSARGGQTFSPGRYVNELTEVARQHGLLETAQGRSLLRRHLDHTATVAKRAGFDDPHAHRESAMERHLCRQ